MASSPLKLQAGYVRSLQALGAADDLEFNRLPFVQRFVPVSLDGGEVDENVLAGLALDEPKSLTGIEPLYCSLFFQPCFSFLCELFGAFPSPPAQKKGCKCGLAAPSINLKVLQEQQTQGHCGTILLKCRVECFRTVRRPTVTGVSYGLCLMNPRHVDSGHDTIDYEFSLSNCL
jgi:hypothetical protein